jgi:hypothetical protein
MMRSVIVTLSLLAWAATASADCAWVLWEGTDVYMGNDSPHVIDWYWAVKGTYPTRHDCYRGMRGSTLVGALENVPVEALEFGSGGRPFGDVGEFLWDGNGVNVTGNYPNWWSCLPEGKKPKFPDTVDPRGPKGK